MSSRETKRAILRCKRLVKIVFRGCWLAAKINFYSKHPLLCGLTFVGQVIYQRLLDKYTRRVKHKEIVKARRLALQAKREVILTERLRGY